MKYLILLMLAGCASAYDGWTQDFPPSKTRLWFHVTRSQMFTACGYSPIDMPTLRACAFQIRERDTCEMFSYMGEIEAKLSTLHGYTQNIYEHEIKHCDGWRHK